MLRIVDKTSPVGLSMTVWVAADSREEIVSPATQQFAKTAAMGDGFMARGLSASPNYYPVGEEGDSEVDVACGRKPIKEWRAEFRVSTGPSGL